MDLHDFVTVFRRRLKDKRAELMERYNKGFPPDEYHKNVGRVSAIDEVNEMMTAILKSTGDDQ